MKKIGIALIVALLLGITAPALAGSALILNDPQGGSVSSPEFIPQGPSENIEPPVQDNGFITLESRRVFGGNLRYQIEGKTILVDWTAGVAYEASRNQMGALRHVWVGADDESVEVLSFDYAYNRAPAKDSATLTISFSLKVNGNVYKKSASFLVTPQGDGAKVETIQ